MLTIRLNHYVFLSIFLVLIFITSKAHAAFTTVDCDNASHVTTLGIPKAECETLETFWTDTNGSAWTDNTNWDTLSSAGSWNGITTNNNRISRIFFSRNNLSGSIPDLSALTDLLSLSLSSEPLLTGNIPDLTALTALESISISFSAGVTGTIPDLSTLTKLRTLSFTRNELSGPIPDLTALINLESLDLGDNKLTGPIPPSISTLTKLTRLWLANNQLTGPIPDVSALTNLEALSLSSNQLTGSIPDVSPLTSLRFLYFGNNQLTGPVPDLSSLTALTNLILDNNELTGTFSDLAAPVSLESISAANNLLTSTIPDLSSYTVLRTLKLGGNELTGTIPDLSALIALKELALSGNQLTGSIPDLNALTSLERLSLFNNQLTGSIPDLTSLITLKTISLGNNKLSGSIPDFTSLPALTTFQVNSNHFVFSDFETEHTHYKDNLNYSFQFQATVDSIKTIELSAGDTLAITPEIEVNPSGNDNYQWFLNNSPISGATERIYTKTASTADSGEYTYQVTNSIVDNLTLRSHNTGEAITVTVQATFNLNIDGNENGTEATALTDGLLILRYLFGFTNDALIANAVEDGANRATAEDIQAYLQAGIDEGILDIDNDGEVKALTDGLLVLRYLFGFTGDSLVSNAIGETAMRTSAADIEAYLLSIMP